MLADTEQISGAIR